MIVFNVPADFQTETLIELNNINQDSSKFKVNEVYGQISVGDIYASGRMIGSLPKVDIKILEKYVIACDRYDMRFSYTLNASCMGNLDVDDKSIKQLEVFINELTDIGINTYTIALPSLIDIVQSIKPRAIIKASAICEINSIEKALHYKNRNIKRMVVDPDITLRFDILKNICAVFDGEVEIIANNMCLKNCPYKMFHYNHEAHCSKDDYLNKKGMYYYNKCALQKAGDLSSYIKLNWIRPEDLHFYYDMGIKSFKIQGRNCIHGANLINAVKAYFSESLDGNLMDLLTLFNPYNQFQPYIDNKGLDGYINRFYENPAACSGLCGKCNYCVSYTLKCTDMKKLQELNGYAKKFYTSNNMITEV